MALNANQKRLLKRLGWTEEEENRSVEAYLRQGNKGPYYELGAFYHPAAEGSADDKPYPEKDVNWLVDQGYISREPTTEPTTYRLALTEMGRTTVEKEGLLTE